jgi:putative acetyltransferase
MNIAIAPVQGEEDITHIRALFSEYHEWLGVDLCFQGFQQELKDLPGKYSEPRGTLTLAREGDAIAGCVGLWPLEERVCEMKRLYVRPAWRGRGLGRKLALVIIDEAKKRGYQCMRLDTLPQLKEALGLYRSLGFVDTKPYYNNPLDGVSYLELALEA